MSCDPWQILALLPYLVTNNTCTPWQHNGEVHLTSDPMMLFGLGH